METPDIHALLSNVWVTDYVGQAVVFFRNLRGMTQVQLKTACGLSLSAIKRLEAGRKNGGWIKTLEIACKGLGINIRLLFDQAAILAHEAALKAVFLKIPKVAS